MANEDNVTNNASEGGGQTGTAETDLAKRIKEAREGKDIEDVKKLVLDNCRATDVTGLTADLKNLTHLSMINTGLVTLEGFPHLPKLKKLELADNRISGTLEAISGLTELEHLNLSGNRIKDFDALKPLQKLTNLRSLDLYNCGVTHEDGYRQHVFAMIPSLEYLDSFDRADDEAESDDDYEEDDEVISNDEAVDDDDNEDEEEDEDDEDDQGDLSGPGLQALYGSDLVDQSDDEEFVGDEEEDDEDDDEGPADSSAAAGHDEEEDDDDDGGGGGGDYDEVDEEEEEEDDGPNPEKRARTS